MTAGLEEKSKGMGTVASTSFLEEQRSYVAADYLPIQKKEAGQSTIGWVGAVAPGVWTELQNFASTPKQRHQVLRAALEALSLRYAGALDLESLRLRGADLLDDAQAELRRGRKQAAGAKFQLFIEAGLGLETDGECAADLGLIYLEGHTHCGWRYPAGSWSSAGIERFHEQYWTLLAELIRRPSARVGELEYLSSAELELVTTKLSGVAAYDFENQSAVSRFEAIAKRYPDLPAVSFGRTEVDYRTLNEAANRLAHYLMYFSVRPSSIVAICLPPSIEAVIAKLAVLKLGAVAMVLDAQDDEQSREATLRNCGSPLCITTGERTGKDFVNLERDAAAIRTQSKLNPAVQIRAEHAAEIVLSGHGSSGAKSTLILHRSILSMVSVDAYPQPNVDDVLVQTGRAGSAQASFEFWAALLNGSKLVLPMIEFGDDIAGLSEFLRKQRVKLLYVPEAQLPKWLHKGMDGLLVPETLIIGGCGLSTQTLGKLLQRRKKGYLIQAYGCAESGLVGLLRRVEASQPNGADLLPPASPGTAVYVLDPAGIPVGIGAVGELCVEGPSLAWGRLSESTVEGAGFESKQFGALAGGRYYRTGELVRWTEGGRLERIARLSQMSEFEGTLLNLYEIERALRNVPYVLDCAVVVREIAGHLKRLVAYVQLEEEIINLRRTLREELSRALPGCPLPSDFVRVQSLPLNRFGEVERESLSAPAIGPEISDAEADARAAEKGKLKRTAPRSARQGLWGLWKDALRKIV